MFKDRNPILGIFSLILITTVAVSLCAGVVYTRNGAVLRSEDPSEYWLFLSIYGALTAFGVAAFLLLTNGDIAKDLDDRDAR